MNRKEFDTLHRLENRLNAMSAMAYMISDSLEKIGLEKEDGAETAHIELVARHISYELAAMHEQIEKMLADGKAVEGGTA